jgi:hypothetical protein
MALETATMRANEAPQDAWERWQREQAKLLARATEPLRELRNASLISSPSGDCGVKLRLYDLRPARR